MAWIATVGWAHQRLANKYARLQAVKYGAALMSDCEAIHKC